jgi:predicted MPP superfamily phosphohydrolase
MKILIIPDVHGRDFWKKPCEDMSQWDKVVFLGDYVDPYPDEAKQEDVIPILQEIVSLKEIYKDKVVLLWGNHDLFYWCEPYRKQTDYWSRHDYKRHSEIEKIFKQHNDLFQFAWEYIDPYGKFLFSHAGVNNGLAKFLEEEFDEVNSKVINDFFSQEQNQMLLAMVSYYRGGWDPYGSIVWSDIHEHYGKEPRKSMKQYFQIFGHTYCRSRIVTKWWAMLDTGGSWDYIEDNVLKDANGNEIKITD